RPLAGAGSRRIDALPAATRARISAFDQAARVSELGDRLLAVHHALDAARIPHAIGGAIALAYCTLEPRGTRDLDVNVFTGPERAKDVFAALPEGVQFSGLSLEQAERDGQVRLRWGDMPVDLFLSVLPFHDHVAAHVRLVPFEGHAIP